MTLSAPFSQRDFPDNQATNAASVRSSLNNVHLNHEFTMLYNCT